MMILMPYFHMNLYSNTLGTSIVYYGDEIGMTGYLEEFKWSDTKDPYATRYCNETDPECYTSKSRDPMRSPMQVGPISFYFCQIHY